ncbi:MAG TPA: prepilin-type N-terminal cleavage/methylation domain-containing protein [Gammaproteobacteria bacterium]|nr:prepilin-type N-terminal cleavage/methylation domain-containing protein [Gammaproteobacteria bacterium]
MRKLSSGFTLIELIVFIVIVGIAATTALLSFQTVLSKSPNANHQTTALELAEGRMDIIMGQYYQNGFAGFADICPGAAVCMTLTGYTVTSSITGSAPTKTITVTVTGLGSAILTMQVWS